MEHPTAGNNVTRKFRCLYELQLGSCIIAPDEIVREDEDAEQGAPGTQAITHVVEGLYCNHYVSRRALKPIN